MLSHSFIYSDPTCPSSYKGIDFVLRAGRTYAVSSLLYSISTESLMPCDTLGGIRGNHATNVTPFQGEVLHPLRSRS